MERGAHLDQTVLLALLDEGCLEETILDAADPEPLPQSHPLREHPKVLLTPHVAGHTSMGSAVNSIIENLRRYKAGTQLIGEVNRIKAIERFRAGHNSLSGARWPTG